MAFLGIGSNQISTRISAYISLLILSVAGVFLWLFVVEMSNSYQNDRNALIDSVGDMYVGLIDRPLSQGNFIQVESDLQTKNLPVFIKRVAVYDAKNTIVAQHENGANTCPRHDIAAFPIVNSNFRNENLGAVQIQYSNCELQARLQELITYAVTVTIILILLSIFLLRKVVTYSFRPLHKVIGRSAASDSLDEEVVRVAPAEIRPLLKKLSNAYQAQAKGELADEVAHNLSSPIWGLGNILPRLKGKLSHEEWNLLEGFYLKIRAIANNLNFERGVNQREEGHFLLDLLLNSVVISKQEEFASRAKQVKISVNREKSGFGHFVRFDRAELEVILSNLINNSYDAIGLAGTIDLFAEEKEDSVAIRVVDTGDGIPDEVLPRIFESKFSHGKEQGNGIGLAHAKKVIEAHGGKISVRTKVGIGTEICLEIPKAERPSWFLQELNLQGIDNVVIVDDERHIHSLWQDRLGHLPINIMHIHSIAEFNQKYPSIMNLENTFFIVDFEFTGEAENGVELIQKWKLSRAVLSTNKLNSKSLFSICESNQVPLLPKWLLDLIPIRHSLAGGELVLLDDDNYLLQALRMDLEEEGFSVNTYSVVEDLVRAIPQFHEETVFVLDSDLGSYESGVSVAALLRKKGFKNLILCSGHSNSYLQSLYGDKLFNLFRSVVAKGDMQNLISKIRTIQTEEYYLPNISKNSLLKTEATNSSTHPA